AVGRLLEEHPCDAVMHFASHILVGESVADPAKYYANNVGTTLALLQAMRDARIDRFIFSSTAAVYGVPSCSPIPESHALSPINPYGQSKLMVERILADYAAAYGLKSVCLRYFNAAGADPDGELGERHDPETHLIPLVLQAASGRRADIAVFGRDYPTRDGTCVRDYIHVTDLAEAHLLALEHLANGGVGGVFNLGTGIGYTVAEVIEAARLVTGRPIAVRDEPRRLGDPPELVADPRLAMRTFGWQPRLSSLETMLQHAWRWTLQAERTAS
ncbi:MAG TPA: UDP-glucose 4-epimerase GalE, partial [Mariprofundaceae bacterium]|nr:UDP-glucose 4-epimerase GalE [Mariprofundaceae bacterium]